jgi:hypothetical protein
MHLRICKIIFRCIFYEEKSIFVVKWFSVFEILRESGGPGSYRGIPELYPQL